MTRRFVSTILLGLIFAALAHAQTPPVRVLASNGVRAVLKDLIPQCERAAGRPLDVEFALSASVKRRIENNESFDVTILASDVIDALIKEGKLAPRSRVEIGRSGVGVGIRAGAEKPDVSTPEAMKQTLLNAKALTYAEEGASRRVIDKMIQDLGIADRLKPKTKLSRSTDQSMEFLFAGQADIVMTLISEILPVKGADLVGPLPPKFQDYVTFSTAISDGSKNVEPAQALIKFITGPAVAAAFKAKGIEPHK
jgi:molybdate transport system substrate-binding protein